MDVKFIKDMIEEGESITVEFKSWVKTPNFKELIKLSVKELVALANTNGGYLLIGVEDNKEVTGCSELDEQNIIESIYDRTVPNLYTDAKKVYINEKVVMVVHVDKGNTIYATSSGECYKRLGKNSKPFYPEEMKIKKDYQDYSSKIIDESTIDDINLMEVYNLKEKLKVRDQNSTLFELDDMTFLRDLSLIKDVNDKICLTVAGLLFVGKEESIKRLLPQAEVIYLHYNDNNREEYDNRLDLKLPIVSILDKLTEKIQTYNHLINVQVGLFRIEIYDFSERVFQEALLNALSHRRYDSPGSVYVKHYSDRIVIENPGGFLEDINEHNIITHPSLPRNKLIAETLQRLKYVQRTGQGIDIMFKDMITMGKPYPEYVAYTNSIRLTLYSSTSDLEFVKFIVEKQESRQKTFNLSELMILRYLYENKNISLANAVELTQRNASEVKHVFNQLEKEMLIELSGRVYMLTAQVYNEVKSDVHYTQDKTATYLKSKHLIIEYLEKNNTINRSTVMELCRCTNRQAGYYLSKLINEQYIVKLGVGKATVYRLSK